MTRSRPARATTRRTRVAGRSAAGVLVAILAITVALDSKSVVSSSLTVRSSSTVEQRDGLGQAGGAVPDGTTVFEGAIPGVAKLDPALLGALRQAATDAEDDGVELIVDSGWRSPAYQERLLQDAISKYGSAAEAARWVATPTTSAHVSGHAVDLARDGAAWLSEHGAAYGLCRIYDNEPWHYELRPEAADRGCPPTYADPTQDPRMQR